jgi:hypothetical protein
LPVARLDGSSQKAEHHFEKPVPRCSPRSYHPSMDCNGVRDASHSDTCIDLSVCRNDLAFEPADFGISPVGEPYFHLQFSTTWMSIARSIALQKIIIQNKTE